MPKQTLWEASGDFSSRWEDFDQKSSKKKTDADWQAFEESPCWDFAPRQTPREPSPQDLSASPGSTDISNDPLVAEQGVEVASPSTWSQRKSMGGEKQEEVTLQVGNGGAGMVLQFRRRWGLQIVDAGKQPSLQNHKGSYIVSIACNDLRTLSEDDATRVFKENLQDGVKITVVHASESLPLYSEDGGKGPLANGDAKPADQAITVLQMTIENMDFQKLDTKAKDDLEHGLRRAVAKNTCLAEDLVSIALHPGSVKVIARINAPAGHTLNVDRGSLSQDVLQTAKSLDGVQKAAVGELIVTELLIHGEEDPADMPAAETAVETPMQGAVAEAATTDAQPASNISSPDVPHGSLKVAFPALGQSPLAPVVTQMSPSETSKSPVGGENGVAMTPASKDASTEAATSDSSPQSTIKKGFGKNLKKMGGEVHKMEGKVAREMHLPVGHHGKPEEGEDDKPVDMDSDSMLGLRLQGDEVEEVQETYYAEMKAQIWKRFDSIFGSAVIVNAIVMGLQIDDSTKGNVQDRMISPKVYDTFELVFLIVFSLEFTLRLCYIHCNALKDAWMYLDLFLITTSAMDMFSLSDELPIENPSAFTVIRTFRLVRLFRIVRLVRLLKELYLLVQGMIHACRVLFWAIILLLLQNYIISILMTEMVGKVAQKEGASFDERYDQEQGWFVYRWGRLTFSMLTLGKITTFDGWAEELRPFYLHNGLLFCILLAFTCASGLGIINLVVGVMCETSFAVKKEDDEANRHLALLAHYRALMSLRALLQAKCAMYKGTAYTRAEIKHFFDNDPRCNELLEAASLRLHDVVIVLDAAGVHDDGTIELDRLIEALCWLNGRVEDRCLDINLTSLAVADMNLSLRAMASYVKKGVAQVLTTTQEWQEFTNPADHPGKSASELAHMVKRDSEFSKKWLNANILPMYEEGYKSDFKVKMSQKEVAQLEKMERDDKVARAMSRFDGLSGFIVLLNSVMVGLQVDEVGADLIDYNFLENVFLVVFIVELMLRTLLFVQLNYDGDFRLLCFCCPRDQEGRWGHMGKLFRQALPELMRDTFYMCDVLVISLSLVDILIFWVSDEESPFNVSALIRIIRLARTARVFRLIRLLKELWLLVQSMVLASKSIFWTVCLLGLMVYVGSILMVQHYKNEEWAEGVWFPVGPCMWSLLNLITFNDWAHKVRRIADTSVMYFFIVMIFVVITALGVLNLIVGMMCETAITLVNDTKQRNFRLEMLDLMHTLKDLEETLEEEEGTSADKGMMTHLRLKKILRNKKLVNHLWTHGKIHPRAVWDIFRKLDVDGDQSISQELFIEGLLRSRQKLQNEDIVVCLLMMNNLRQDMAQLLPVFQRRFQDFQAATETLKKLRAEWVREGIGTVVKLPCTTDTGQAFAMDKKGNFRFWRKHIHREADDTHVEEEAKYGKRQSDRF